MVDARIIAATNSDLKKGMAEGNFGKTCSIGWRWSR